MPEQIATSDLIYAIREMHGCESTWLGSEPVTETYQGAVVWEGRVQVFEVQGHPEASRCYCWSHAVDGTDERKVFCVLGLPPVDSPAAAVRAAIVDEHQRKEREYDES